MHILTKTIITFTLLALTSIAQAQEHHLNNWNSLSKMTANLEKVGFITITTTLSNKDTTLEIHTTPVSTEPYLVIYTFPENTHLVWEQLKQLYIQTKDSLASIYGEPTNQMATFSDIEEGYGDEILYVTRGRCHYNATFTTEDLTIYVEIHKTKTIKIYHYHNHNSHRNNIDIPITF